jgi:hypothetical protein
MGKDLHPWANGRWLMMMQHKSLTLGTETSKHGSGDLLSPLQALFLAGRMMAVAIIITVFSFVAMPSVMAAERINTNKTNCAAIQSVLVDDGAAILRYPSNRVGGLVLYDRYVGNSRYCGAGKIGVWANVPAKDDNRCRVIACQAFDRDDLFPRGPFLQPYLRLRVGS